MVVHGMFLQKQPVGALSSESEPLGSSFPHPLLVWYYANHLTLLGENPDCLHSLLYTSTGLYYCSHLYQLEYSRKHLHRKLKVANNLLISRNFLKGPLDSSIEGIKQQLTSLFGLLWSLILNYCIDSYPVLTQPSLTHEK